MVTTRYTPHLIREDFVDFVLGKVNPLWRWKQACARIEQIKPLPDQMVGITLRPNRHLTTWQPGQFVMLSVPIEGVRHQRAYSIVSLPGEPLQIAIKQQGKVSRFLAEQAKTGMVVDISQPAGYFVLAPDFQQTPLLLIATGSGITPMLPLLRTALPQTTQPVTLIYFSRDPAFRDELNTLAQQYPHFDLRIIQDSAEQPANFSGDLLDELVPDAENRLTYVCAAPVVMQLTRVLWHDRNWQGRLIQESFLPVSVDLDAAEQSVNCRRAMREFKAQGNLLASAEAAGLKPAYGCRMGICNTCVCQKVSGTTRNLLTGELDDQPNRPIRLCITEAVSPLDIDL